MCPLYPFRSSPESQELWDRALCGKITVSDFPSHLPRYFSSSWGFLFLFQALSLDLFNLITTSTESIFVHLCFGNSLGIIIANEKYLASGQLDGTA